MLISLIGYRGTGKTTVGHLLAERLGWTCLDTDERIEREAGVSIRQIFESEGEVSFRDREVEAISNLARMHKLVLSLGGGAILREENRRTIKVAGPVVWLTAEPEEIFRRMSDDAATLNQRPNLTTLGGLDEIERIMAERRPLYETCSDCQIDTQGKSLSQIVDEILTALHLTAEPRLA